ncbi:sensor histidine kinase [Mumia sp. DW29H23]|uniref:sensor histidine kinase n=1 Tax=Mumia sp. DW29H23 TaxID=3421241 RepID=UPI003D699BA5
MRDRTGGFRLPVAAQDLLLAAFVAVMQVQGVRRAAESSEVAARPLDDLGLLGPALLAVSGLALAVRRRWPVPVFVTVASCSLAYYAVDLPDGPTWLALFVALYTVTAYGDGRRSLLVAAAGIGVLSVGWLVAAADIEPKAALGWVFFRIGASVMSAALGESVRSRKVIAADAVERAELAERTREDEARARVDAERLRIAREVHDTVAHAIAIINVQAGVTAHVLDRRPERAKESLTAIEQTSAQALREIRTILGVLRADSDDRAPLVGIEGIDDLVAQARDAGLDVKTEAAPPPATLPSTVSAAVYRIVQESLTNVIRHAGPTRVTVVLAYEADAVAVRVTDEGPRGSVPPSVDPAPPGVPGRGLVGMQERCDLLGGALTAGPLPDGGFEVSARLPVVPAGETSR